MIPRSVGSYLTALVLQKENKGGRVGRPLSLCISHRMSIPNRFRLSRLASFFFTCAICSSSPCSHPFISSPINTNVLPRVLRIVHLGFSLDSLGPGLLAWHVPFFVHTFHSSLLVTHVRTGPPGQTVNARMIDPL